MKVSQPDFEEILIFVFFLSMVVFLIVFNSRF